ncbi:MAG TPA: 1,2-phenylacetyl-CoA epoxidase subunit PaaC [Chitinophagaceae bacterium]|nr:1,2-phenylacetyl-CoA epoxidase subunit PaaC [Chitinophagaceae bacterium]
MSALIDHTLYLADNSLILGQRNSEWCGHGPVLEQDIAITNISLDLIGQARNFYQYAAILKADGSTEDSLAYLRTEREYKNCLLVEQPIGDWAQTILRQYLFSQYQYLLFQQLQNWNPDSYRDEQIAAIAVKSLKETAYHLRWSREWVIRLGDGTEESRQRMLKAIDELWRYTGEMFIPAGYEKETGIDFNKIKEEWNIKVDEVFSEASLIPPSGDGGAVFMQTGGKEGRHSEHLGYILTELQYLQRTYPNCEW